MIDVQSGTVSGSGLIVGSLANSLESSRLVTVQDYWKSAGDFIQGAQGSLLIEIGGSAPRTDFDVLVVPGNRKPGRAVNRWFARGLPARSGQHL